MVQHIPNTVIVRRREVERMIGLSRSTIYKMIADGDFPKPIKLGARAVGWRNRDIVDWLDARAQDDVQP